MTVSFIQMSFVLVVTQLFFSKYLPIFTILLMQISKIIINTFYEDCFLNASEADKVD